MEQDQSRNAVANKMGNEKRVHLLKKCEFRFWNVRMIVGTGGSVMLPEEREFGNGRDLWGRVKVSAHRVCLCE